MSSRTQRVALEPSPRQRSILDAALRRFGHYGFRRTSMEDIARDSQISRTALYRHFRSKEDLLRALSADLYQRALATATEAARSQHPLADRLFRTLDAKMGFFYELILSSEHGLEILDENNRLCGDITAEYGQQYLRILTGVIRHAQAVGEFSPQSSGLSPQATAEFFLRCAEGQTGKPRNNPTPSEYRLRLRQLVNTLVIGFGGKSSDGTER